MGKTITNRKRKWYRVIMVLLIACLLSLAACGKENQKQTDGSTETITETASTILLLLP